MIFERWRTLRRLRREEGQTYFAWRTAIYAYQDAVTIFIDTPHAWSRSGPIEDAARAETEARHVYERARRARQRAEETL